MSLTKCPDCRHLSFVDAASCPTPANVPPGRAPNASGGGREVLQDKVRHHIPRHVTVRDCAALVCGALRRRRACFDRRLISS